MRKRTIRIITLLLLLCCGCAGRDANPIPCYMTGDENLSCENLKGQIVQLQADMLKLLPKTDKTLTNALWVAGGMVAYAPYLFVDAKDAEKIEYEAFRRRHNRLLLIAERKGCDFGDIKAEPIPRLEHRKIVKLIAESGAEKK